MADDGSGLHLEEFLSEDLMSFFVDLEHERCLQDPAPITDNHTQSEPPSGSVPAPPQQQLQLDDNELERFVDEQRNQNTKRRTKSDMKTEWCKSVAEKRNIGDIPEAELDRLLGHFFCKVRKENGELYEPDTLTAFQRSLDRHLTKELHKSFSIIQDCQFASSREKLKASRKMLKKEGKGNKPNAPEPLEKEDLEKLWATAGQYHMVLTDSAHGNEGEGRALQAPVQ